MKQFFTLFLFTLASQVLYSQPADLQRYGCRFAHQHLNHLPLTAERQAAQAASNARSDTFDILHYRIFTDLTETTAKTISGNTEVFFSPKLPDIGNITLDLLALTVDSVQTLSGQPLAYTHQGLSLKITLQEAVAVGDTGSLRVFYHGKPIQSTSNFGGVYFDAGYIYNLSIGLNDDPHNFGHAWFPCFDNFQERSTYEMSFMTVAPYRAYAVGDFVSEFPIGPNRYLRSYKMDLPLATYQVSFAAANYGEVKGNIEGAFGDDIPLLLLSKLPDTNKVKTAFLPYIGDAVRGFELWYGRHTWNKVGYAMTTRGAMENPGNIIYPDFLIQPANLSTHLEIMSHELAHHWWGDVVTVGSESDMWIKEGPAEYGSHQFFEYIDGKNEFIERLRANTHTVLKNAHYDDGGFLPLSPMPHEVTYGTHTYNKGAMVMHNLRAYLGDSLFATGMQHLQEAFRFDNMNAYEMRDTLSAFTGVDLTDFYEDCVFSPGFTDIDVETVTLAPNNNTPGHFYATVKVRQQVRAAPHLYHNVPVEVNFRSATGQTADFSMVVPAEEGTATFDVPFEPAMTYLNGNQRLNTACIAFDKVAKTTGTVAGVNANGSYVIKAIPQGDSAYVRIEHHWTAPRIQAPLPPTVRPSSTHYWRFDGIWPQGFVSGGLLRYDRAIGNAELDKDLTGVNEDSLILMWKPFGSDTWQKHPYYTKLVLGSMTDGSGYMRIDTLYKGEYALANGTFDPSVDTEQPDNASVSGLTVQPNPTSGDVLLWTNNIPDGAYQIQLTDMQGRVVRTQQVNAYGNNISLEWSLGDLPEGGYLVYLSGKDGRIGAVSRLMLLK